MKFDLSKHISVIGGSVLDLRCGDLAGIAEIADLLDTEHSWHFEYYGIDPRSAVIAHHQRVFPWFRGECAGVEDYLLSHVVEAQMILLRDALDFLCNGAIEQVIKSLREAKWGALLAKTTYGAENSQRRGVRKNRPLGVDIGDLVAPLGWLVRDLGEDWISIKRP